VGDILIPAGNELPFNERSAPFTEYETEDPSTSNNGPDHWYEIDPSSPVAVKFYSPDAKALKGLGKIFTTRMPRCVDFQKKTREGYIWTEGVNNGRLVVPQIKREVRQIHPDEKKIGVTDLSIFEQKLVLHRIQLIVSLTSSTEDISKHSNTLLEFLKSTEAKVIKTPFTDFTAPPMGLLHKDIVTIADSLARGVNVLVHCMGGTGRAGSVVVATLANLGLFTSQNALKFAHTIKSNYVETPAQMSLVLGSGEDVVTKAEEAQYAAKSSQEEGELSAMVREQMATTETQAAAPAAVPAPALVAPAAPEASPLPLVQEDVSRVKADVSRLQYDTAHNNKADAQADSARLVNDVSQLQKDQTTPTPVSASATSTVAPTTAPTLAAAPAANPT